MKPLIPCLTLLALLTTAVVTSWAQAPTASAQLTPTAQRISDAAIDADYRTYENLQARIEKLNEAGLPVGNYHLSKAQSWLDVSLHEYTRNDRSSFPQDALNEAAKLITALENKITPSLDTPPLAHAPALRPDLWARVAELKEHSGLRCAAHELAKAEVELVHASHELQQQQWRHAKPYVQMAEDALAQAQSQARACSTASSVPMP
jgi:OmpA-OmpF porin, OOP family